MRASKEVTVDIAGRNYVLTSDDDYLEQIGASFEPAMVALFRAVADDSRVILDVGANIGCTALLFASLARRVIAFEPSPSTFAFLQANIGRAGVTNIVAQNFGLGAQSGAQLLTFAPSNRAGGFISDRMRASSGHTVEEIFIQTMDQAVKSLALPEVDFIKIDVEGFEGHVLRGATQTLAASRPPVVLELNHWCLNAFQRVSIPDFFDFLRSVFPILLAVDGANYLDLHDPDDAYVVTHHHIVRMRFPNILAAFDESRLRRFRSAYTRGSPV